MPVWLYRFLYWVGGAVCHQLPERSLSAGGRVMPLCARCAGLYLSIFITAVVFVAAGVRAGRVTYARRGVIGLGMTAALLLAPVEIDGLGNLLGFWGSDALIRIITGCAAGVGLPVFFIIIMGFNTENGCVYLPAGFLPALPCACAAVLAVTLGLYHGWLACLGVWIGTAAIAGLITALTALAYILYTKVGKRRGISYGLLSFTTAWAVILCLNTIKYRLLP